MKTRFFTKKSKLIFLIFLTVGIASINLSLPLFNSIFLTNGKVNEKIFHENDDNNIKTVIPETAEYQTYDGVGESLNITLHQSLDDTTTKQFTNLEISNSFTEPFPRFVGYNTSFINISINNINAPNKSLTIESGTSGQENIFGGDNYFSFWVKGDSILDNFSICFSENHPTPTNNASITLQILNARWYNSRIEPGLSTLKTVNDVILNGTNQKWHNYTNLNVNLDVDSTYNNFYFIRLIQTTAASQVWGIYHNENNGVSDDCIVYKDVFGTLQVQPTDPSLKIDLKPLSNTPLPSQIGLKVNASSVVGISAGSGYWLTTNQLNSDNNLIEFQITADWWDVSCDVTNVKINYTKSDILAYTVFTIPTSGQDVRWNVTNIGGLNYFDSRITDFNTINYTIPRIWNEASIKVFNGTTEKTSNINKRLIDNKYREIQILNAGNGTYWYLNATSSNLLTSIDTFVGGIPLNQVNFSNTVKFNSTFSEIIYDGTLNLSVFSPIPRYLNHTQIVDISLISSNDEFDVSDWNIYEDVKSYGIFKIQMSWNNDTAAGFLEDYLTIIADTELILSLPKSTFDSSETFDLTVFFNDTGQNFGIDADTITYQIGTSSVRTDKITPLGNGYYEINIDCNDTDFAGYGIKSIEVNTSKYFYNNQTKSISFSIIGNTELIILNPLPLSSFDSGDTFNITLFYNDTVKNVGIDGAIIEYQLNSSLSFKSASYDNYAPGYYNITLIAADSDFNGYGIEDLIFNASKQYYHNQSESLSIRILGETSLTALKVPSRITYNASETVIIRLYFNDTIKNVPVDGATISYEIESSGIRYDNVDPFSLGSGYYDITIDCNDTDFNGYGAKSVTVYINKDFHYNKSQLVNFFIFGETDLTTLKIPDRSTYNASESLMIRLYFNDIVKNVPVDGATISYEIESSGIRYDKIDLTSIGPGYYDITIDCNDTDFNGYGLKVITIYANKDNYHNQSRVVPVFILGETSLNIEIIPDRLNFNASEIFTVRLYFNDTVKNIPVDGAIVSYEIGSAGLRTDNIDPFSLGPGYYDISIDCNDTDFNFYGVKSISIFINLGNYHNKSQVIVIQIFGETSLSLEKVPDQAYYDSSESMVLSLYFNDTVKNLGIIGGTLTYRIESGPIRSDNLVDLLNGFYEITIDCNDTDFNGYGSKYITVFLDKTFYHNQTTQTYLIVVGYTVLRILSPNNLTAYYSGQTYNITIEYFDTIKNAGITGATISYLLPLSGSPRFDNIIEIGNGIYRIEVSVNDGDFDTFGYVEIDIYANQDFYLNRSNTFTFHRQITTTISPSNFPDLGSVLRGLNISYMFNYSDTDDSAILNANWSLIGLSYGFLFYLQENGNGNYTFHFNTTFADVSLSPFTLFFNISAYGKQTQILQINIDVLIIYTDIVNPDWDDIIARNAKINQTFTFYFNNTVTNEPVKDLISSDIIVRNEGTSSVWNTGDFNWELINPLNDGNYILRISLKGLDSGRYYLSVNVSKFPNYNYSIFFFSFYLRGNFTEINIDYFSDVGGQGVLQPTGQNYSIYIERNLYVNFTIIDLEFGNRLITGAGTSVLIQYFEIGNLSNNGTLSHSIVYDANTYSYKGNILTSAFSITSNYIINITIFRINYENSTHSINLTLKAKHTTNITVLIQPSEVTAGDSFVIHFQVAYLNGSIWIPLTGTQITLTPYFDGIASTPILGSTNSTGGISIEITIRRDAENMSLLVQLASGYYYTSYEFTITDIEVIPFNPGFRFEDILPYIIIIGAAVAVAGGSVGVYRGVVVPKKREKQRILSEVKTIFDDAINLEHILVLYKATGTCIFFKSYGSEQIDPELIGGFLTAVSSFGKEMVAQEALNEISYGDKMLLLADGEFIRVALVLGKKASLILRQHLKEFIDKFEKVYNEVLPNWRGQLNYFRNAGEIVDDIFNTSIILPHQITYDFSNVKDLKNPHSKDILKIAHSCCEETEREFFFIATLLKDASEKTNKDTAEIFMGVKELRDKRILIPIEISAIEPQAISQQEMNLIGQKVSGLSNLTAEEKQKLVADLAQMGPMQREAYLSSLMSRQEIISAPIKMKVGTTEIESQKSAKNKMKELLKRARIAKGKKNYTTSIEYLHDAAMIASSWELSNDFLKIEEYTRIIKIEDLTIIKKEAEQTAKLAVKKKNYAEAAETYKKASKIASEIFKLGATEMTKEVKRLTNKANEYEKLK